MSHPPAEKPLLSRRAFLFGAANIGVMGVLVSRLYYLQFMRAEEYTMLAEDNRMKLQLLTPVRGLILDRNNVPLANNQKNYRLFLDAESKNPLASLQQLAAVINLTPQHIEEVMDAVKDDRHAPALIREHLSWDELAQFEFFRLSYPEIFVDIGQVRYYPLRENASHLIGYVGAVSEAEAQKFDEPELAHLPDFKIGKNGVEKMFEKELRGTAGVKQTEVNVHGLAVRELGRKEGTPGKTIRLTIDSRLQEYACARLNGESAAAVVMNVKNGDVLALASVPGYEPNSFSKGITAKYWGELQANPRNPLMNKAITGQYPPGSTFKICMAVAALENDVINPSQRVFCNGTFMLGNHPFTCWKPHGHGSVNLHDAIAQSCDVFFYTMAQRLGIDRMMEMARKLGLGKLSGLGLPGEKPGIAPDDEWKHARYGQSWQGGDTINVGIGQGYILTTPLQLAVMAARIANGGFAVTPRLTASETEPEFASLNIREDHLAAVQDGMNAVTNTPSGTGYSKRILDPRFLMAGKTGTSQVKKLVAHGIDQNSIPWEDRHHAWFMGYAPVMAPRYAAAVIIEHGGGGASAAAPVVRDLLLKIQSLDIGEEGPTIPVVPKTNADEEVD